jgi:hypothetical protein
MKELVYCSTPSRLSYKMTEILDFVTNEGNGPLHPFQAYPLERFEGGPIGREKTMEFCRRLIAICDKAYLFGIAEGALDDIIEAKRLKKPITVLIEKFDPEWKKYYDIFIANPKYEKSILEIIGRKN